MLTITEQILFTIKNNSKMLTDVNVLVNLLTLVVSDLRLETKGSRFDSDCRLCAELSLLQQLPD